MNTFFVTVWLREILQWIYGLVHNYGIAVIIFTVLIRTVLTPFEVKSRKGMRKMSEIQPRLLQEIINAARGNPKHISDFQKR